MGKKNLERIKLSGAELNEDFVVISKFTIDEDCLYMPYEEDMDLSNEHVLETVFFKVEFVYDVGPSINISLAVALGLGVIQSLSDGSKYLYHADVSDDEDRQMHEMLRLGMYYQIMNPDYDDRRLDYFMNGNGGEFYLSTLLFADTMEPIEKLRAIFATKKGQANNVVEFVK